MEEVLVELAEVVSKLHDLRTTFSRARGEWNDGYTQGIQDAISMVNDAKRKFELNNSNNQRKDPQLLDLDLFKKNYFKKGYNK